MADKRVHLYVPTITSPGYPSGHTVTNFVWAAILGDIWPEKRAVFDMRAETIGMHRIDGGAHFFHDIEGGKQLAKLIYQAMSENGNYRQELADAQAEAAKLDKPKKAAKKKKAPLASPTSNRRKAA